jgi:peptidoglycan hydrolase-like protein with peptidoglycan-binding domain
MGPSARRPDFVDDEGNRFALAAIGFGRMVFRNPALVGGSTAFLVALSFVSANALWYQPHAHSGAFFVTRDFAGVIAPPPVPDATIRIERPPPDRPSGDPKIREVQSILRKLDLYEGDVDGIAGPATRQAITDYQARVGLAPTESVDDALLDQLGASPDTAGIVPIPAAATRTAPAATDADAAAMPIPADRQIMKLQAGLRAFGNEAMEVDGVLGARTRAAIHEFQALFGLPETGEPDDALYAKMREIGLTN